MKILKDRYIVEYFYEK